MFMLAVHVIVNYFVLRRNTCSVGSWKKWCAD